MTDAPVALVVARAENGVIGRNGELPWRMKSDLAWFKKVTLGKPVVMGRKTYDSIGKALPGRVNIVVTRNEAFRPHDALTCAGLDEALALAQNERAGSGAAEICVIGGGTLYRQALALADRLYLTTIEAEVDGDTHFPDLDPAAWRIEPAGRITKSASNDHDARLEIWHRASTALSG